MARMLTMQLGQDSLFAPPQLQQSFNLSNPSRVQNLFDSEADDVAAAAPELNIPSSSPFDFDVDVNLNERSFILSQDFFCTPDYITPNEPLIPNSLDCNKENTACPMSPEKIKTIKGKRQRREREIKTGKATDTESRKNQSYVSQSAVALRYQVFFLLLLAEMAFHATGQIFMKYLTRNVQFARPFLNSVIAGKEGLWAKWRGTG